MHPLPPGLFLSHPLQGVATDHFAVKSTHRFCGRTEISGQSLPDFFESRILGPLGMDDTAFDLAERDHARLVVSHSRVDGILEAQPNQDV